MTSNHIALQVGEKGQVLFAGATTLQGTLQVSITSQILKGSFTSLVHCQHKESQTMLYCQQQKRGCRMPPRRLTALVHVLAHRQFKWRRRECVQQLLHHHLVPELERQTPRHSAGVTSKKPTSGITSNQLRQCQPGDQRGLQALEGHSV